MKGDRGNERERDGREREGDGGNGKGVSRVEGTSGKMNFAPLYVKFNLHAQIQQFDLPISDKGFASYF